MLIYFFFIFDLICVNGICVFFFLDNIIIIVVFGVFGVVISVVIIVFLFIESSGVSVNLYGCEGGYVGLGIGFLIGIMGVWSMRRMGWM